jgi:hypothetical protein
VKRCGGVDFGPLDHLAPEDADLYRALYLERNTVSRGEAQRVANTARAARQSPGMSPSVDGWGGV